MYYKFTQNSKERQMFLDYWNLCQKHWEPEDTDEYWKAVIADVYDFVEKHGTVEMASHLGVALVNTLEEKLRGVKK